MQWLLVSDVIGVNWTSQLTEVTLTKELSDAGSGPGITEANLLTFNG